MTTQEMIDALENADIDWCEYSGRGMYGRQCVAVRLGSDGDLFKIGQALHDCECGAPMTDSLGRGRIAYWPCFKIGQVAP